LENYLKHLLTETDEFDTKYYYAAPIIGKGSIHGKFTWWPDRYMDLQTLSPFLHFIGDHFYYRDFC
jgi:hypothetical protein